MFCINKCIVILQPTLGAWRTVFLIAAGIYVIDSVIFAVFGSSKIQKFNEEEKSDSQINIVWKNSMYNKIPSDTLYDLVHVVNLSFIVQEALVVRPTIKFVL